MINPCESCPNKQEDIYGLLCDLSCGKHSMYVNYQAGIKEALDWFKSHKVGYDLVYLKHQYELTSEEWQSKLKEWGL